MCINLDVEQGMSAAESTYHYITVSPLTAYTGVEIGGVDIAGGVSDDAVREIHAALMRYHVVFFRDQDITPRQQVDFAARFGRLREAEHAAFGVRPDVPEMHILENDADRPPNVDHYHSDGIFRATPEFGSMLRGVIVPPAGGDTIWTSLTAAYDALSEDMRTYLRGKRAVNDLMKLYGSAQKAKAWEGDGAARMDAIRKANPPVEHPLVRLHPVTGRPALYYSESFTAHVVGVSKMESDGILAFLARHTTKPEFQCRFKWRPNSVALWDNRASMHYAVADYWPAHRLMNRVSIETDEIGCPMADPIVLAAE
jgi:taurine dioxygenase